MPDAGRICAHHRVASVILLIMGGEMLICNFTECFDSCLANIILIHQNLLFGPLFYLLLMRLEYFLGLFSAFKGPVFIKIGFYLFQKRHFLEVRGELNKFKEVLGQQCVVYSLYSVCRQN